MIEKACGHIPGWMATRASPPLSQEFSMDLQHFLKYKTYYKWTHCDAPAESLDKIKRFPLLEECIHEPLLVDLLKKMLAIDPLKRISCVVALRHPFFQLKYE
jgi:serine/threonine protein kinase